jgi:hypothetical protein
VTADLSFSQLEQLVANAGGSPSEQEYLAGISAGVESGGDPTAQNSSSTASGLWQELTTTWVGAGGSQFAPTAKAATPAEQAQIAVAQVNADAGYAPWAPDMGGSYGGTNPDPTTPLAGSPVATYLAGLGPGATSGTTTPATTTTPAPATTTSLLGSLGGDLLGGFAQDVEPFFVKAILVIAGLGILGIAAYKAASPAVKSATQSVSPIGGGAGLAELAAA